MDNYNPLLRGLSDREVSLSREKYGSNILKKGKSQSFFKMFLESFGDPIIKILLVALIANLLFMFRNSSWFETIGIAIAIFLATFISTLSEYGSESAFKKLQEEASRQKCRVRRSGSICEIPIDQLVVGDICVVGAGERIAADGVLLSGRISVDESALTGESEEIEKRAENPQKNQVLRGGIISSGEGVFRVSAVGGNTSYGKIASEVQEAASLSPLKLRLSNLASTVSTLGYIAAAIVIVANLFFNIVISNGFNVTKITAYFSDTHLVLSDIFGAVTLAITVLVMAVPEGLPMMITVVLSANMKRMLKDKVLVRKLVGIETAGSINILMTDKTGTLTTGKLKVESFLSGEGREYDYNLLKKQKPLFDLLKLNCLYNTSSSIDKNTKKAVGSNATDRALIDFFGGDFKINDDYTVKNKIPFNSDRKFSSVLISGDSNLCFIKGAPEKLLPFCDGYYNPSGKKEPLKSKEKISSFISRNAKKSARLIAVCTSDRLISSDSEIMNLTLVGIVCIKDSVRPSAIRAVREVLGAGIGVMMITGDNKETAAAVAREIGLISGDEGVFESGEISKMSEKQLKEKIRDIKVVARALPSDKSRLVSAAKSAGLVVGMTGDGINDAPALKKADVGFAMGSGTEVAKEAGDIIILDNNFASISKAVLYGRTIFKSIRKFIIFQLTVNLSAVAVSVVGPFLGVEEPITVIQMLWVNMIMDTLAALAFAGEAALPEYMKEPPKRKNEPIMNRYMYSQILFTGLYTTVICLLFLKLPVFSSLFDRAEGTFMTAFFTLFILFGVFNCFNARTYRLNLLSKIGGNPMFWLVLFFVVAVQLLLIYFGGRLFRMSGLLPNELLSIAVLAFTVIPIDIVRKIMLRLGGKKGNI